MYLKDNKGHLVNLHACVHMEPSDSGEVILAMADTTRVYLQAEEGAIATRWAESQSVRSAAVPAPEERSHPAAPPPDPAAASERHGTCVNGSEPAPSGPLEPVEFLKNLNEAIGQLSKNQRAHLRHTADCILRDELREAYDLLLSLHNAIVQTNPPDRFDELYREISKVKAFFIARGASMSLPK